MAVSLDDRGRTALSSLVNDPESLITVAPGATRERRSSHAALTGAELAPLPVCTREDVERALEKARAAQPAWEELGIAARRRILLRFHDLVWQRQDALLDLIQYENGKARAHAFEELADVAMTARYYAATAASHLKERRVAGAVPLLTRTRVRYPARGVVAVIAPWNYPFTLVVSDAVAALAAGNAVLIKPDGNTRYTALAGVALLREAGVPAEIVQVVTGSGAELAPSLIGGSDYAMFTGSTEAGRSVAAVAGENLVPVSAELGGKNPLIVCDDANLARAVPGAVKACFSNAGQLCISIERIYVHEKIWDRFVPAFTKAAKRLRVGANYDWNEGMGPLLSEERLKEVSADVNEAVAAGAQVLAGGRALAEVSPTAYAPTVLTDIPDGVRLAREETFGPVVSLYRVADDDEAVARANDSRYGLNASVWTSSASRGREIAARLRCGTVNVNEGYAAAWASTAAPMGGMGDSGLGRRHGAEGIVKYTQPQTVAVQRLQSIQAPKALGEKAWARVLRTYLRARRALDR